MPDVRTSAVIEPSDLAAATLDLDRVLVLEVHPRRDDLVAVEALTVAIPADARLSWGYARKAMQTNAAAVVPLSMWSSKA